MRLRLRPRLTLVMLGVVAAFAALTLIMNTTLARSSLYDAIDAQLLEQADVLANRPWPSVRQALGRVLQESELPEIEETAVRLQIVDADGEVLFGDPNFTVDPSVLAAVGDDPVFGALDIDGRPYRVMSQLRDDGSFVHAATAVDFVDEGLADLQRSMIFAGVALVAATAAAGWFIAGRFVEPVVDVAGATRHLADHGELPEPIASTRTDEVGDLVDGFNALVRALDESADRQRRLVSDASHELRTPLTSLRVKIDFLDANPQLDPRRRGEVIQAAAAELAALTGLVADLVTLASNDEVDDPLVATPLADVVAEVVAQVRATTGRELDVHTDDAVVTVRAQAVRRALSNLIDNAIKHGGADGTVEVRQRGDRFEVADSGPGIAAGERDRVFDRFHRAPTAHDVDGSGIGLAIVAHVAEEHGGTTWVEDAPSGGAIVGFSVASGD